MWQVIKRSAIPVFLGLRQEGIEFKASLDYMRPCLQKSPVVDKVCLKMKAWTQLLVPEKHLASGLVK